MVKRIHLAVLFFAYAATSHTMGGEYGKDKFSVINGPKFVALKDDEPVVFGTITTKDAQTTVHNINFSGQVTIGGMQQNDDQSFNILDLTKITKLEILDPFVPPTETTPDSDSRGKVKVRLTFASDGSSQDFLLPPDIAISAIEQGTDLHKVWLLRKIHTITIEKEAAPLPPEAEKGVWSRIKSLIGFKARPAYPSMMNQTNLPTDWELLS